MPTISRFMGIEVRMPYSDHPPPHVHVRYAEHQAAVFIRTGELRDGSLPPRVAGLVGEWMARHRDELLANWERMERGQPMEKVAPLE